MVVMSAEDKEREVTRLVQERLEELVTLSRLLSRGGGDGGTAAGAGAAVGALTAGGASVAPAQTIAVKGGAGGALTAHVLAEAV